MDNYLVRGVAANGQVKAFGVVATGLVSEAQKRHNSYPTATAALGRTLMGALLLGSNLKNEDTLTLRVFGDGPLGGVIAQANAKGEVRGYVQNPQVEVPPKSPGKLDVGKGIGEGHIYVTKDMGLKEPYTGMSPIVSGEIAEDLTHYLYQSEQVPSIVALGVLVDVDGSVISAGGYIIQLMPGAEEDVISKLEQRVADIPPISNLIKAGKKPEEILDTLLGDMELKLLAQQSVGFKCGCSKERLEKILISLGEEELQGQIETGQSEVSCHFCNEIYTFNKEELESLLKEAKQ